MVKGRGPNCYRRKTIIEIPTRFHYKNDKIDNIITFNIVHAISQDLLSSHRLGWASYDTTAIWKWQIFKLNTISIYAVEIMLLYGSTCKQLCDEVQTKISQRLDSSERHEQSWLLSSSPKIKPRLFVGNCGCQLLEHLQ